MVEISDKLVENLNNSLGIWYAIILNAFGVIAILLKFSEYQIKNRKIIFLMGALAQVLWTLHFAFMGDFSSCIACIMSAISIQIFSLRKDHKWAKSPIWIVLFLAVQMFTSIYTFGEWKDIFSILAGILCVFAYCQIDLKKFRFISIFYCLAWVLNSATKIYVLALICDVTSLISVLISFYRYDIKGLKVKDDEEKELDKITD